MNLQITSGEEKDRVGREMYQMMVELFPLCRSLTGNGLRETYLIIKKHLPLETYEIPTGTRVFDWTVPKEWNIRDAYIISPHGEKIIDFQKSNLHVVNYSIPVNARLPLAELRSHLHTLPDQPDVIPYITSYYEENWGFCLSHRQYMELPDGEYDVLIDSSLEEGHLTYGEFYIRGEGSDEVLISCYTCHPSLCNDNLSGVVLTVFLAKHLSQFSLKYSYRFLFIPETIGAITWLCMNEERVSRIKHGLVITCAGDPGCLTYKKSRQGNAEIDRAVINVLRTSGSDYKIMDFFPWGSDERQFCSPAFNLHVGSLMRTPYGAFPEYHTSVDNLDFVRPEYLADSFSKYVSVLYILENNSTYVNSNPKGEPQLGKRGLYKKDNPKDILNIRSIYWVLNLSDGNHSLLDISDRSNFDFVLTKKAADILCEHGLLKKAEV